MNDDTNKSAVTCVGISHVIYYVTSMRESVQFYTDVLGLKVVDSLGDGGRFLRTTGSPRHFDLGLVEVGDEARIPVHLPERRGVYHVAWQVRSSDDFIALHA